MCVRVCGCARVYISVTRKCNIWNNTIGISRNNIRIWARLDKYRLSHRNSSSLTDIMILYTLSLSLFIYDLFPLASAQVKKPQ